MPHAQHHLPEDRSTVLRGCAPCCFLATTYIYMCNCLRPSMKGTQMCCSPPTSCTSPWIRLASGVLRLSPEVVSAAAAHSPMCLGLPTSCVMPLAQQPAPNIAASPTLPSNLNAMPPEETPAATAPVKGEGGGGGHMRSEPAGVTGCTCAMVQKDGAQRPSDSNNTQEESPTDENGRSFVQ